MASENKEQIESNSKRARMSPESEACLKEVSGNSEIALKRLDAAGENLSREDIEEINKKRTLIQAVKSKNLKMVKKLLDHGATIDIQDEKGETPLFYACRNGHSKIAAQLMKRGANVNMKNFRGEDLLSVAFYERKTKIFYTLLKYGAKVTKTIFGFATMQGNLQLVQVLLDHGAELNDFDDLQLIVGHGHLDVLKVLIKYGVDLNKYTRFHCVPLHYAIAAMAFTRKTINRLGIVRRDQIEIISELLKNGANPYLPDDMGNTSIHRATRFPGAMKVFLKEGGFLDLNVKNNNQETVLEIPLRRGWKDTAKMLFHYNHHN